MAGQGRTPPAWRAALLDALARGLSVKEAARTAGVGVENAYSTRRRDAGFAADWARARAAGAERLTRGDAPTLAPHEVVRRIGGGRSRVERAGPGRWSAEAERRFLDELATTGNVSRAARAAGVSAAAVYKRRADWPGFAERWRDALAHGWAVIEGLLIERASATLGGGGGRAVLDGDVPSDGAGARPAGPAPMTVAQAITVYGMHRASVTGEGRTPRHGWRKAERPIEEVRADILRRVKLMGG